MSGLLTEELSCSICQEIMVACHNLPCGHTFCGSCLVSWLEQKTECPDCRAEAAADSPRPVRAVDQVGRAECGLGVWTERSVGSGCGFV